MNDLVDTRERTVERIVRDKLRFAEGLDRAQRVLTTPASLPAGGIYVDLDGSARVRSTGLSNKIDLVHRVRARIEDVVRSAAAGAVVVDCGTRDETYVVVPTCPPDAVAALAQKLWACVRSDPFILAGVEGPVSVTASVGFSFARDGHESGRLLENAVEAQSRAKQRRDAVVGLEPAAPLAREFTLSRRILDLCGEHGVGVDVLASLGGELLSERRGPLWHWLVDRLGPDDEIIASSDLNWGGVPDGHRNTYAYLVDSVAFESLLAAEPARVSAAVAACAARFHFPTGTSVSGAEIRAGESGRADWVAVNEARFRTRLDDQPVAVSLPWSTTQEVQWNKLMSRTRLSSASLLTEAALLALDDTVLTRRRLPPGAHLTVDGP